MRTPPRPGESQAFRHIAVIGSGISGLSAAWLLSRAHSVTLFETEQRPGGHSNTVMVSTPHGDVAVDTGFIVYNERNYPNLTALLGHLGAPTQASDMSFGASLDGGRLEYSSAGLRGLIGNPGNVTSRRFWRMLRDLLRFYREAPRVLGKSQYEAMTLGEYLDQNAYSATFIDDHLLPMGAAIWSATAAQMREYPLIAFVRFFAHHGLLDLAHRPVWRTVTGGSTQYVRRMLAGIPDVRLGSGVTKVTRSTGGVVVSDGAGKHRFDDVVIATHADDALKLLSDADETERALLGSLAYTANEAVLHSDVSLMPRQRGVWASWNYIGEDGEQGNRPLCVTYWMNRLQKLDNRYPLFVTLNPTRQIDEEKVVARFNYTHPLFDRTAVEAQQNLWQLQGRRRTFFAGSYFGHGFHEDALQAGLAAAEAVGGVRRPWNVANESGRIALAPVLEAAE